MKGARNEVQLMNFIKKYRISHYIMKNENDNHSTVTQRS